MPRQRIDPDREPRMTYPTASFSLSRRHLEWLTAEAIRRNQPKSVIVRELFDGAMRPQPAAVQR